MENLKHEHKGDDVPFNEVKDFTFEIKQLDEEQRIFEGYASIFGNVDAYGDVVQEGAFKKTLQERGDKVKILWQHDPTKPIGKLETAEEDSIGLKVKGKISETALGDEALQLMKDGVIDELSIGYDTIKKDFNEQGNRLLKEVKLYEVSPVTFAANSRAVVTNVKSVVSFQDFPLADRDMEWSADDAVERLREFAGGPDKEDIDWSEYQTGFMWYNEEAPEQFGSYKLPYVDVVTGVKVAVPRAIFAIAGVLQGAMGGVNLPEDVEEDIKVHCEKYYAKMREEFEDESIVAPWNSEESSKHLGDLYYNVYINLKKDDLYDLEIEQADIGNKEQKVARTLSQQNFERLEKALQLLQEIIEDTASDSYGQSSDDKSKEADTGLESGNHSDSKSGDHSDDDESEDHLDEETEKMLDDLLEIGKEILDN